MQVQSQIKALLLLITLLITASVSCAQSDSLKEIEHFELSVIALDMPYPPELFYENYKVGAEGKLISEFKPMSIGINTRSKVYQIPINGQVNLYRNTEPNGTSPEKMQALVQVPAKANERLLLVFHRDPEGKTTFNFIDDSSASHPANTVRFANFGQTRVAASIGGKPMMIEPSDVKLLGEPVYFDPQRFQFVFAVERKEEPPYKSPQKNLRFSSPKKRLLIVYSSFSETVYNDDQSDQIVFEPRAYRLYDNAETL